MKGKPLKAIFMGKLSRADRLATRIVFIYLLFGLFWIFFSDTILASLTSDYAQLLRYSTYKGWIYILITAILLYILLRSTLLQQLEVEQSLQISEERWKFALEGAGDGVWDWNLQSNEVFRSARWHEIYGYAEDEVGKAHDARKLIHPDDLPRAVQDIEDHLSGKTPYFISEFRLRRKDGTWVWTLSRGMIVKSDAEGKPLRMIGTHTDISDRKQSEAQIFRMAHYDRVTGLPNRTLFLDRLEQDLRKARRAGQMVTLMFLDLDRFKEVNDSLGHDMGDMLLKETAKRLLSCVRASDTVARLGGDEFTIILNGLSETAGVERIAQEILTKLATPFQLDTEVVYITTSIGITLYPNDAKEVESLLKNADQAMYAAKDQGRDRFYYFMPSMQQAAAVRMAMVSDLRLALIDHQFQVYYQPIIDLKTGATHKAEALIHWQHPTKGLVSPFEFIPIAEDTGLITEIGDFVFSEVATQLALWRMRDPDFQISINKSPVQFKNDKRSHIDWISHLQSLKLPGDSLTIEITEGLLLEVKDSVAKQLDRFHEAGIGIAIDDFGTGYSSLAYLKKFDIDFVKIDQSFTRNIAPGSEDMALCEAIIVMSHKLGIRVVAEGVETIEQQQLLTDAGCDYAQGYLFSRPLPAADFEECCISRQVLAVDRQLP